MPSIASRPDPNACAYLIVEIEALQLKIEQVRQRAELDALGRVRLLLARAAPVGCAQHLKWCVMERRRRKTGTSQESEVHEERGTNNFEKKLIRIMKREIQIKKIIWYLSSRDDVVA